MQLRLLLPSLSAALVFATAPFASALPMILRPWRAGALQFSAEGTYFTTKANYEARGSEKNLSGSNSFTFMELEPAARYHFTRDFSAYFGGDISSSESKKSGVTRANTTFSRLFIGGDYAFMKKPFFLVGEIEGSFSADPIKTTTDNALTSDGVHFIAPRLIASKRFSWGEPFATLGFKYRTEGLSGLMTYELGAQKTFSRFTLGLSLGGYESMIKDSKTQSSRTVITTRVDASSLKFYSYNPTLMELKGWVNWQMSKSWALNFKLAQSINGSNMASGTTILLGAVFSLPPSKSSGSSAVTRSGKGKKAIIKEFDVDTNEADPALFKEDED